MSELREQVIRERAYALWEQDGRPEGRSLAHWSQAQMEIAVEQALTAQDEIEATPQRGKVSSLKATVRRLVGVANRRIANFGTATSLCSVARREVERIRVFEVGGKAPRLSRTGALMALISLSTNE
jgi:hypothetical protein